MKRLSLAAFLFAAPLMAQTAVLNDSVVVNPAVQRAGMVITKSNYDQDQVSQDLSEDGGFEKPVYKLLIQVSNLDAGSATVFASADQFATYPTNFFTGGTYNLARAGNLALCSGSIVGNTLSDIKAPHLTATLSGSTVGSVAIASASIDGLPNGTYSALVSGGSGSGAAISFTITGATLGTGYTGGTISTASVTAAGSGYASAPTVIILPHFVLSSCGASGGFSVGDFVDIVLRPAVSAQADFASAGWVASLGSGATFGGETSDISATCNLPAGSNNTQAAELVIPSGSFGNISEGFDNSFGGKPQNYVNLTGSFTLAYCAKTTSSGTVAWSWGRGSTYCSGTDTLTTSWALYSHACTATDSATVATALISLAPSNNQTAYLDNVTLKETTSTTPTGFRNAVASAVCGMHPGSLRYLTSQWANDITNLLEPSELTLTTGGYNEGAGGWPNNFTAVITIPQALALSLYCGADMWYPTPPYMSVSDSQILQQYLSDPCTTGVGCSAGSLIRFNQGTITPWTTQYQNAGLGMWFELANENWNGALSGMKWLYVNSLGTSKYTPYGYAAQSLFSTMKAVSTYNSSVEHMVLGAQTAGAGTTFALDALAKPGTGIALAADAIAQAPYTQLNATAFSTTLPRTQDTSALGEVSYNALNAGSPMKVLSAAGYSTMKLVTYEYHNSTLRGVAGVPTQAELSGWSNGEGYGIDNALSWLLNCHYLGYCTSTNLFTLGQYSQNFNNGSSSVSNYIWGDVVGMGAVSTNGLRPSMAALSTVNACIPAGAQEFQVTTSGVATWNFSASNGVPAQSGIPQWYVLGYKAGSARCIVVVNPDPVNSYTIAFSGTNTPTGIVTQNYYYSANLNDTNETAPTTVQQVTSTPSWSGTQTFQPHSITAFSFTTGGSGSASPVFSGSMTTSGHVILQ